MKLRRALTVGFLSCVGLAPFAAMGDVPPRDAAVPVQVVKGRGEFAKKLNGAVMPTGKGWRSAADLQKRVQLMVPDKWKVDTTVEGPAIFKVMPPLEGKAKTPTAILMVLYTTPRDADPLEVEEPFAVSYADELAKDPALVKLNFKASDAGLVIARGMKFALAGGTMSAGAKQMFQQEQMIYIDEERIVTIQFTCPEVDFDKYSADVAKIFSSYQNTSIRKEEK